MIVLCPVSIRRADLGLLEHGPGRSVGTGGTVSIRRADLGLLEPGQVREEEDRSFLFQSAGRIWGFWNSSRLCHASANIFVSIRRADLGLLERRPGTTPGTPSACFNPPGGFGAFGTHRLCREENRRPGLFQSAGRIWGFWNSSRWYFIAPLRVFQSAGRIWGFWNHYRRPSRRAGYRCFNPPGGFGAFGTLRLLVKDPTNHRFQSAGRIWGFWNPGLVMLSIWASASFNPPGGFGAFGTTLVAE
ncbi:hypothetical protein OSCT_0325 [Oscillochloris trichoides DG-6]|uniref:Uncharacterized protein n=1 Tax=Oscillochloris trichoides DG-6 TaxID=765420 RepID=E1IAH4_9CHLR|nr:hypothetical protein OSCT_0325 [Oscillochloris trichoides DG-6]